MAGLHTTVAAQDAAYLKVQLGPNDRLMALRAIQSPADSPKAFSLARVKADFPPHDKPQDVAGTADVPVEGLQITTIDPTTLKRSDGNVAFVLSIWDTHAKNARVRAVALGYDDNVFRHSPPRWIGSIAPQHLGMKDYFIVGKVQGVVATIAVYEIPANTPDVSTTYAKDVMTGATSILNPVAETSITRLDGIVGIESIRVGHGLILSISPKDPKGQPTYLHFDASNGTLRSIRIELGDTVER